MACMAFTLLRISNFNIRRYMPFEPFLESVNISAYKERWAEIMNNY